MQNSITHGLQLLAAGITKPTRQWTPGTLVLFINLSLSLPFRCTFFLAFKRSLLAFEYSRRHRSGLPSGKVGFGKVLYLGVSDTPAWVVAAANTYAKAQGKTQFSIYQGRWNVMLRDFERGVIPMARHFGMALAPWDVLGGRHFQSKK